MTGNSCQVVAAGPADMEPLISVMVLAFAADPVARWMYREPQRYLAYFGRFIRAFAGKAFSTGTAWCIDGNLGAALWLPPGVKPDEDAMATILDESVRRGVMTDVNAMFAEMVAYHPRNPHWYLPTIGIEPSRRGARIGAADGNAQPLRPRAHAGLPGIQQLRQHRVIPAARLRRTGHHTCGPFTSYGPDAARCTLTSLVEAGPSWLRSIAPVVDDPELRDQGRCGSQQSSVALGMTLFVNGKEYNWQTCEDPWEQSKRLASPSQ